jgi:hypothetical protein
LLKNAPYLKTWMVVFQLGPVIGVPNGLRPDYTFAIIAITRTELAENVPRLCTSTYTMLCTISGGLIVATLSLPSTMIS